MKTLLRLLHIHWWKTVRAYASPHFDQITNLPGYGYTSTRHWRHQQCRWTGCTRRQFHDGASWITIEET